MGLEFPQFRDVQCNDDEISSKIEQLTRHSNEILVKYLCKQEGPHLELSVKRADSLCGLLSTKKKEKHILRNKPTSTKTDRIHLDVNDDIACTGRSQQCPPATIKIEKVDRSLRLFGVSIGNNCQISLPAFGVLFLFIGIVLTFVAFKPSDSEVPSKQRQFREDSTTNIKILGPVCIVVGATMITCALLLKYFSTKQLDEHTRVGFYCPVHGDFYPLSPSINPRKYSFSELTQEQKWWFPNNCLKKNESANSIIPDIPTCPHSVSQSNRSSFDGQQILITNPNPTTVIITTTNVGADDNNSTASNELQISNLSVRSLSVPNADVVSFPSYRSHSNPPTSPATPEPTVSFITKRSSCPTLPEIGTLSQLQIKKLSTLSPWVVPIKPILHVVKPKEPVECVSHASNSSINSDDETKKRKSVSILLPLKNPFDN